MSMDYTKPECPDDVVLELTRVSMTVKPPFDVGLDHVDLIVRRGELVLIQLEQGLWDHPLADLVSGLIPAEDGTVNVFGVSWIGMSPDRQAQARWRIGRVFERRGWMSNLDVDENITLSERHHSTRPESEIYQEAKDLARIVGLDALPVARPAVVNREDLRRAEWVRAALGSPWLVVMERPGQDLERGWIPSCAALVEKLRRQGTAVIWMCEDGEEWNDKSLNPSLKLRSEGNTLRTEHAS